MRRQPQVGMVRWSRDDALRLRCLLAVGLALAATLVAAVPAQSYDYYWLRSESHYLGAEFRPTPGPIIPTPGYYALERTTTLAPDVLWRFQPAGTLGFRGPTLFRIVNRQLNLCLDPRHQLVTLTACTADRSQVWMIDPGGGVLRGAGNTPSRGSGYQIMDPASPPGARSLTDLPNGYMGFGSTGLLARRLWSLAGPSAAYH
jgi:hypothetical protein